MVTRHVLVHKRPTLGTRRSRPEGGCAQHRLVVRQDRLLSRRDALRSSMHDVLLRLGADERRHHIDLHARLGFRKVMAYLIGSAFASVIRPRISARRSVLATNQKSLQCGPRVAPPR